MTDRNKMMIIFVKLRLCNEKCSSSTKTQLYYSFKPNLVENEALKNFNKSTYLQLQPLHHLLLFPCLSSAVHDERGHPHQWFFFQKRHLREVNCAQDQLHFFSSASFFSLTPKTLMTTTYHQHSQTPNNLPIVWCLTNNLLTSWSLILLNLNSSKKSPQSMSCLTTTINQHLQSSTFFSIWPTNLTTKFLT